MSFSIIHKGLPLIIASRILRNELDKEITFYAFGEIVSNRLDLDFLEMSFTKTANGELRDRLHIADLVDLNGKTMWMKSCDGKESSIG